MFKKIKNFWSNTEQPRAVDWLLLASASLFCYLLFSYTDIFITAPHGIHLWDTQGYNFYSKIKELTGFGAVYPFFICFMFALWNFPLWIAAKQQGIYYHITLDSMANHTINLNILGLLWAKLMLVVFLLWSAYLIYRIAVEADIPKPRAKWAAFLFLTSLHVIMPVLVVAQYDILYVPFMLLGLLAYLKNNERHFILWMMLAVVMKTFAIFMFFPLLLIKEKDPLRIIVKTLMVLSPLLFNSAFFTIFDFGGFRDALAFTKNMLLSQTSPILHQYSLFACGYILTCVLAYTRNPKTVKAQIYDAVYFSFLSYAVFFLQIGWFHYYWIVLMMPFMVLLIMLNPLNVRLNLLLDTAAGVGLMLYYGNVTAPSYVAMFGAHLGNAMKVLPRLFPISGVRPYRALVDLVPNGADHIYASIYFSCIIAFIALNFPREQIIVQPNTGPFDRGVIWLRFASIAPFIIGILFCYFYTGSPLG